MTKSPVFCDPQSFAIDRSAIRRSPQLAMDAKLGPVVQDRDSYPIPGHRDETSRPVNRQPARVTGDGIDDIRQTFSINIDAASKTKGIPMPTMSSDQHELCLKYLIERLAPEEQQELQSLLGGEGEMPDSIAEDAAKGRIAFDRLPARLQRQFVRERTSSGREASDQAFYERFPDAKRLK